MVSRVLGMILFILVFVFVYFGMHFYVFFRLSKFLAIEKNWIFYSVVVFLVLSFPLMSFLERAVNNKISQVFYTISAVWLGTLFFLFLLTLIYDFSRLFRETNSKTFGILILVIAFILVFYSLINAMFINIKTVEIPVSNLEKEIKIVQISDAHVGTIHRLGYLQKIVDKTNKLGPDIVMITGDLFDGGAALSEDIISPLNNFKAKTFFTIGNHEQYEGVENVIKLLNKTKIQVLRNEITEYDGIQIIGADNPEQFFSGTNNFLDSVIINKSKPSVLMYHPPQDLKKTSKAGINLQLSGHTHNGQIAPFNFVVDSFFSHINGLYNYNGTFLYVSPGTGTWGPPFRLGSRSEITVIKLVKK